VNELRGLRDANEQFRQAGISVLAISNDEPAVSNKLVADLKLPFPILSDADESLLKALGLLHPNAKWDGNAARPTTYILDRNATVRWFHTSHYIRTRPDPVDVLNAAKSVL
jgi:peroxiredoxin